MNKAVSVLCTALAAVALLTPAIAAPSAEEQQVRDTVESWAGSWLRGDYDDYVRHYAPGFVEPGKSRGQWERQRRDRLARNDIRIAVDDVVVQVAGDTARARFSQRYETAGYADAGVKEMTFARRDGRWLITGESFARR